MGLRVWLMHDFPLPPPTSVADSAQSMEGGMTRQFNLHGRRDFLKKMTAFGAVAAAGLNTKITYQPSAKFEITVSEVELRRTAAGRLLMARVYQPTGTGPFPTILDLHGGAWNAKDR